MPSFWLLYNRMIMNHCCICQKPNKGTGWVCKSCIDTYGLKGKYKDWPDWVKACVSIEKKSRNSLAVIDAVEIPFCDMD